MKLIQKSSADAWRLRVEMQIVLFVRYDLIRFIFVLQIVDTLFIGRYVLLALVSAVFLVAIFMLLPFHFLEPVYAKAIRSP